MNLIVVVDEKWSIGCNGTLLTHLPGDLKYFKEKTQEKVVIMGRVTLESLPMKQPLPNRKNIVLTEKRDYKVEGATVVHSLQEALDEVGGCEREDVFVIGGEKIYTQFLPLCNKLFITKIYQTFKGDTSMYNVDEDPNYYVNWESDLQEENGIKYKFVEYRRK